LKRLSSPEYGGTGPPNLQYGRGPKSILPYPPQ
jgi:hypothetical protein